MEKKFSKTKLAFVLVIAVVLSLGSGLFLSGCGKDEGEGKIKVVCTIFPQYDWAKNLLEGTDDIYLKLLVDDGTDMHSYEPSLADVAMIKKCDVLIYCGGESDEKIENVLKGSDVNPNMKQINLLDILIDDGRAIEEDDNSALAEEKEYDEHVWMSLVNAQIFVDEIEKVFEEVNPQNKTIFQKNAKKYTKKLENLQKLYEFSANEAKNQAQTISKELAVVVADRFPFVYLFADFNINHYQAFSGCSTETDARPEVIIALAHRIDELSLDTILVIEHSDQKVANTVRNNTQAKNQEILTLNSMQSISKKDADSGASYLKIMQDNLFVFDQALSYVF